MSITEEQGIWFPGIYGGRQDPEYTQMVEGVSLVEITRLVQKRSEEDGEWAIANGFVGENNENEDKMRRMMAFVSDETNIRQCVEHLMKDGELGIRSVDWVCRDLANASKYMVR